MFQFPSYLYHNQQKLLNKFKNYLLVVMFIVFTASCLQYIRMSSRNSICPLCNNLNRDNRRPSIRTLLFREYRTYLCDSQCLLYELG